METCLSATCYFQDRQLFSTYVVAAGLQYGMGEQIFHYFFKVRIEGYTYN